MSRIPRARSRWFPLLLAAGGLALAAGCSRPEAARITVRWLVARPEPAFDPDGPPDPVRNALERLLTRPLVSRDSGGVEANAAESWSWSADSLTLAFRIRSGLRFTDGSPCRAVDFARALTSGLARTDHSTRVWELASVRGVDQVRAGRALPALGIETPDSLSLVLHLARRDAGLLDRLARPGVTDAWKTRNAAGWTETAGLGPMRVVSGVDGQRLTLALAAGARGVPDTILMRFATGEGRARAALRTGTTDLVWPLPPGLAEEPLPVAFRAQRQESASQLLLVMRADLPPANRLATRRALVCGLNRPDLLRSLGSPAAPPGPLLPGARAFEAPGFDLGQMRQWMEQGKLGRSFHVAMAYDADGPGARIARVLQEQWTRGDVYVELSPRRGKEWQAEALQGNRSHLLIAEYAPLEPGLSGALAPLVMPARGPAVGSFRTGWRTREFDAVLTGEPRRALLDPVATQVRLEQELIALPLAGLATEWIERTGTGSWRFGPWPGPRFARR